MAAGRGTIHIITGGGRTETKRPAGEMACLGLDPSYSITFMETDGASSPASVTDEALVIMADIGGFEVRRILVDNRSSADILYYDTIKRMGLDESKLVEADAPFVGFNGGMV